MIRRPSTHPLRRRLHRGPIPTLKRIEEKNWSRRAGFPSRRKVRLPPPVLRPSRRRFRPAPRTWRPTTPDSSVRTPAPLKGCSNGLRPTYLAVCSFLQTTGLSKSVGGPTRITPRPSRPGRRPRIGPHPTRSAGRAAPCERLSRPSRAMPRLLATGPIIAALHRPSTPCRKFGRKAEVEAS